MAMSVSLCSNVLRHSQIYTPGSVRPVPIRILTVGKKRSRGVQLMVDEYMEKLKHYCSVDDIQIRSNPKNARDVKAQVENEDTAVMCLIRSDDWIVMLDEHGLDIGSVQMAELLRDAGNTGASRLSFCIGGPYGHGRQLRKRANISIKLSSMGMDNSERAKIPSLTIDNLYCVSLNRMDGFWDQSTQGMVARSAFSEDALLHQKEADHRTSWWGRSLKSPSLASIL